MVQSNRAQFYSAYRNQDFALPDSIIFYIAKNPKIAETYLKMIQTCKYFFVKNPILVVPELIYANNKWNASFHTMSFDNAACKFWPTYQLQIQSSISNAFASSPIPKIYQCDVKDLSLFSQIICYHDFLFLSPSAVLVNCKNVTIKYDDGKMVELEKLVEAITKVKSFQFFFNLTLSNITSKTFNELLKIPHFSKLGTFRIGQIPETFNLEAFYAYMKKNQRTKFWLSFYGSISQAYKNQIEEIVDEIIATNAAAGGVFDYKPPFLSYPEINREKFIKLHSIHFCK